MKDDVHILNDARAKRRITDIAHDYLANSRRAVTRLRDYIRHSDTIAIAAESSSHMPTLTRVNPVSLDAVQGKLHTHNESMTTSDEYQL